MHRGAMVARVGRAGPCETPDRAARWRAPDIMSSFRSGRSAVVFPSGWGRRLGVRREDVVFPVSHGLSWGGSACPKRWMV